MPGGYDTKPVSVAATVTGGARRCDRCTLVGSRVHIQLSGTSVACCVRRPAALSVAGAAWSGLVRRRGIYRGCRAGFASDLASFLSRSPVMLPIPGTAPGWTTWRQLPAEAFTWRPPSTSLWADCTSRRSTCRARTATRSRRHDLAPGGADLAVAGFVPGGAVSWVRGDFLGSSGRRPRFCGLCPVRGRRWVWGSWRGW